MDTSELITDLGSWSFRVTQVTNTTRSAPQLSQIGCIEDKCPTCGGSLAKRPTRKTKCANCGELIVVRTRPIDNKRVLVTQEEARQIEDEWSMIQNWKRNPVL
jgi:DNA-directed RNA polymerase subunit RPC12/RpoP